MTNAQPVPMHRRDLRPCVVSARPMISCLVPVARAKGPNAPSPVSPLSAKPGGRQPVAPWLACAVMRIPCVTMYDYEFVSTCIYNKLSSKVLLPEILPDDLVKKLGLRDNRVAKYPGLKEEVYLWDFKPNKRYLEEIGVETDKPVILIRPEASKAVYIKETEFLIPLIDSLKDDNFIILMPRTPDQNVLYKRTFGNSIFNIFIGHITISSSIYCSA